MLARKRTFREGWNWLVDGLALYRKSPAALASLTLAFWLILIFLNSIPFIGPIASSLLVPLLSIGVMNACREIDAGGAGVKPRFEILWSAIRQSPQRLVMLGGLYLVATLIVFGLTTLIDGGLLFKLMTGGHLDAEDMQRSDFLTAAQVALVLLMPIVAAFWYAPMLVAWNELPVVKALFFSFVAGLRNWSAFLGYGLAGFAYVILLPMLALGIAGTFISNHTLLLALIGAPFLLLLAPTVLASFYVSYREVFKSEPTATDDSPPPQVDVEA